MQTPSDADFVVFLVVQRSREAEYHTPDGREYYSERVPVFSHPEQCIADGVAAMLSDTLERDGGVEDVPASSVVRRWSELTLVDQVKMQRVMASSEDGVKKYQTQAQRYATEVGTLLGKNAGTSGRSTAPEAESASGSVKLYGPMEPVVVNGKEVEPLTPDQYDVVKALVEAGNEGLKKDEIELIASSARKMLERLRADPAWGESVIKMAGGTGRRYRIV